jgi:hypothetical protein
MLRVLGMLCQVLRAAITPFCRGVKRHGPPYTYPHTDPGKRANAVVLVLVRNSEIDGLLLVCCGIA